MTSANYFDVGFGYDSMEEAFPNIDPGHRPLGSRIIVQIKKPKEKTKGGVYLTADVQDTIKWNEQVGVVRAVGAVAFCNRTTGEKWPEGDWAAVGDFVRVTKYPEDKWEIANPADDHEPALFVLINDLDLRAIVTCDPRMIRAFV